MPCHGRGPCHRIPPSPVPVDQSTSSSSYPCGKPDSHQRLVGCDGPCSVFRRLTAKATCFSLSDDLGQFLHPVQMGFGTPGGCEAAVHAAHHFWHQVLLISQKFF